MYFQILINRFIYFFNNLFIAVSNSISHTKKIFT